MATIWTPEVIARETARKKAAGEDLNYGKVIPKTTDQANKTVYNPMSASQASAGTNNGASVGAIPMIATNAFKVLDKPFAGTGVTQGMSAGMARAGMTQGPPSKGSIPPIYNAATNKTGETPTLGYGSGGTYGTTKGLGNAYKANTALISTDAGRDSEIKRTQDVIAARKAAGLDTSGQEKYLRDNLKFNAVNDVTTMSETAQPVDYKALAEAEFAEQLAKLKSQSDQQIGSLTDAWNASNKTLQDNRTLDNLFFQRNNSPFEGRTSYREATLGREREIQDANSLAQFNASVGAVNQGYADAQTDLQAQIAARAAQLEQEAFDRSLAESGVTGVYNGAQTLDARNLSFNQNLAIQEFEEDKLRYGEEVAYKKARDKITDMKDKREFDARVEQQGADAAVSWYNAKTSRINANTNIAQENRIASGGSSGGSSGGGSDGGNSKIPAKESADNSAAIRSEIMNEKLSRADALRYLQANAGVISDSDYNKLMTYINNIK